MDYTKFKNQQEIMKDYITKNPMNPEVAEREEVKTQGSSYLHTMDEDLALEAVQLILKSRNNISEVIWSLVDEDGSLFIETGHLIQTKYHNLATLHLEGRKEMAAMFLTIIQDPTVMGFIYQTGKSTLQIVRGTRWEGSEGVFLITSLNPLPS